MTPQEIHDRLTARWGGAVVGFDPAAIDPWIEIVPDRLADVARFLRDEPDLRFNYLHCISVVDYLERDPKKAAQAPWQPHLEVVYHLSSLVHRHRLVVKASLPRWKNDVPGELPELPSVSSVWSTAEWHEREEYDLGGVRFTGNLDLRRILCADDWVGHPLRKDYEMPVEYQGIRAR